mmetsp:Transcript_17368/g.48365  ORF Transcript_17368/g.48365 Transcript_17368/m.48365 type:complete len:1080 (-) Transcript_17368:364-3603(-)
MASKPEEPGNFARRDLLLSFQEAAQKTWAESKVFEVDAPPEGEEKPKYFGNFPYPYMNGMLHLGHAFTLSKLEFATAFHRLCGKNSLFPQGFHCTGMPIKACADKLDRELSLYGCPPQFPTEEPEPQPAEASSDVKADPSKFKGKKSKAAAKKGTGTTQYGILKDSGIPEAEIPDFRDPLHWLRYFPPLAMRDIAAMGCGVDWRRSFITTDVNPYYDSFVRWQFETLKKKALVVKDKRYAVYSPLDGQPCADHDRATGEGVQPQEYTLIKLKALELPGKLAELEGKGTVFLLAATLRPETMYGQTNCWALPDGKYGAYRGLGNEIYIMAERSALNLSYQDMMPTTGRPECILEVVGQDLMGVPLSAPNAIHERVYVLPLLTILMNKGTGVVTSVPSDSPDDYTALMDLKNKPKLREKYSIKDEWVMPFQVVPIIEIPEFGNMAAVKVCEDLKIKSQNDTAKLAEAKGMVYLKGFTDGVMITGPHNGKKVSDAKPIIKQEMIDANLAMAYSEPEKTVMSRSGDECVVALTDQWYLLYGSPEWAEVTGQALDALNCYYSECLNGFKHTLSWLNQWACSRSFGLGTRLPWDPQFLVESLSDSTIYMAYYTVAHILQSGNIFGEGDSPVKAEDVTTEVWDYVLQTGPLPAASKICEETLRKMRREFEYWYPWDLRVSGKDLIQNHLTFALYNHTAFFAKDKWPRSIRCNGHLLLNSEKMSKSTGNFMTLERAIKEYSADAMRFAMANAGDGMDDANFEHSVANAAILSITRELAWIEETLAAEGSLRDEEPASFSDRAFDNAMNTACALAYESYDNLLFREAQKNCFHDLVRARDVYRFSVGPKGMNKCLVLKYVDIFTRINTPIIPHTCEHIWGNILNREGSVVKAGWPSAPAPNPTVAMASEYIESMIPSFRKAIAKAEAPPKAKKGQPAGPPPPKVTSATVYIADRFVGWQETVLQALATAYDTSSNGFPKTAVNEVMAAVKADPKLAGENEKALMKMVMPFAKFMMEKATVAGPAVLDVKLPFGEKATLEDNLDYMLRSLKLDDLSVAVCEGEGLPAECSAVYPGNPALVVPLPSATTS